MIPWQVQHVIAVSGRKAAGAAHSTCRLAHRFRGEAKATDAATRRLRART